MRLLVVVLLAALTAVVASGSTLAGNQRVSQASWESDWFRSPTGNIRCRYFDRANPLMACVTLNDGAMVGVRAYSGRAFKRRYTNLPFPRGPVLVYGDRWDGDEFICESSFDGMECWSVSTGHGFFINRDSWSTY